MSPSADRRQIRHDICIERVNDRSKDKSCRVCPVICRDSDASSETKSPEAMNVRARRSVSVELGYPRPGYACCDRGSVSMTDQMLRAIDAGLNDGLVIPYLGPGVLALAGEDCPQPSSPTALHNYLAALPVLPLVVHDWYDDLPQKAPAVRSSWSVWGMAQGVSKADRCGHRVQYLQADGKSARAIAPNLAKTWATLLYQPLGSVAPVAEIDNQTPIPELVQSLRTGRHFLFLGCRFTRERDQAFARQIMQRSSATHWAVLPEAPTRNELRFLAEQNIKRLDLSLTDFVAALAEARSEEKIQLLLACW